MRPVSTRAPGIVMILCAFTLSVVSLPADDGAGLKKALIAATARAIGLEIEAAREKLRAAEAGLGPKDNVERFRRQILELEAEQARFASLEPGEYPEPVKTPPDPASVLESASGFGPVLPPLVREVVAGVDSPAADGSPLVMEGASRSGPFYRLAGIAGGNYGILKPGKKLRLELCLVYRREYFGLIGDYYVYVMNVR